MFVAVLAHVPRFARRLASSVFSACLRDVTSLHDVPSWHRLHCFSFYCLRRPPPGTRNLTAFTVRNLKLFQTATYSDIISVLRTLPRVPPQEGPTAKAPPRP